MSENADARELKAGQIREIPAPALSYRPPVPRAYRPPIGLIGCGGIAKSHLAAYRDQGFPVAALCDLDLGRASDLRDQYFPKAEITGDPAEVISRPDIEVIDLVTHPGQRLPLIRMALEADKHVLSQKPFVTDLREGRKLVALAGERNRKLAVNQNGRWAPYFSYLREAVKAGLLGDIVSCDIHIAWDHTWIRGTPFEKIHHIILYDFAIHWFDIVSFAFGDRQATEVFAQVERVPGQETEPPLNANAVARFDGGLASLTFRASTKLDPMESTVVTGTKGTFRSSGPVCANDCVALTTEEGRARIVLEGNWFNDGFAGTMGELLCAIEEDREPENSARDNLRGLELCFAAVASANSGSPITPGDSLEIVP